MGRKADLKLEILRHLLHCGKSTRPELVELTGGRAATVFEVIDQLKSEGVVIEPERHGKKTGRKAPSLDCDPGCCRMIGIDFQPERTLAVVTDTRGAIIARAVTGTGGYHGREEARHNIKLALAMLQEMVPPQLWKSIRGIGFADPGLVDVARGISLRAVNLPGWEMHPTAEWLRGEFALPVGVWTEEMVKTRMEYLKRRPEKIESLFHLGMDGGIGGGFIRHGELFIGATNQGMEIGHIVIRPDGPVCECGNRGCLEAMAGLHGIRRRIREARGNAVATGLDPDDFSIAKLVEAVHSDKAARIIANEVCDSIGHALAVVVALLNPAMIVLGGELTGLGKMLLDAVRRELELNCLAEATRSLRLEFSILEPDDTARGAALMMRDKILLEAP